MIDTHRRIASEPITRKRFYLVLIETVEEQSEVEAFLTHERDSTVSPDLLGERPSTCPKEHLTIAHYRPTQAGWPFVQLCQWPADFAARTSNGNRLFARGAYTFELFRDRRRLEETSKALLAKLDRRHTPHVELIFPDWSQDPDASPH